VTTDNTLCTLPAARTWHLINSRLVAYIIVSTTDHSPTAHVGRAEYVSVARLPASNEAKWRIIWLSARTTHRPSPTLSMICVLPGMTALHLAQPTPFPTHSWQRWWRSGGSYFDERLITDYHATIIGCRKKLVSPPFVKVHIQSANQF